MHEFSDLAGRCANFGLAALHEYQEEIIEQLQTSGETRLVKALQMIQLQKVVIAVGMFSIFEAELQGQLGKKDGFAAANSLLDTDASQPLRLRFLDFQLGINVLKHGTGRSYDDLIQRHDKLPFRILRPDEGFFEEGGVSEVNSLIQVDDTFVRMCAELIEEVSTTLRKITPRA